MPIFHESLPPWLTQQPGILEAGASGAQQGAQAFRNFTSAADESFARKRAELMLPLQLEQQRINSEVSAADLTTKLNVAQDEATTKVAVAKWAETRARVGREAAWLNPETEGVFDDLLSKYPVLTSEKLSPVVKQTYDYIHAAKAAKIKQEEDALDRVSKEKVATIGADQRRETSRENARSREYIAEIGNATRMYASGTQFLIQEMVLKARNKADTLSRNDSIAMHGEIDGVLKGLEGKLMKPQEVGAAVDRINAKYEAKKSASSGDRIVDYDAKTGKLIEPAK